MGHRRTIPPHHEVVYGMRVNGDVEVRVVGPRRYEILYPVLGLAAQFSFVYARPVEVTENGLPFRVVEVYKPHDDIDDVL